ncbi:MAG: serine/threonine-protein kinase [Betaproteobacteria bacterium]
MSSALPLDVDDQTLPRKLGKYTLLRVLGSGATSTVYLAEDPFHRRDVAVKVVGRKADKKPGEIEERYDPADLGNLGLRTEAALLGKLNHPHIVRIFDVIEDGDDHYVVMEFVGGGTMEKHTSRGTLLDYESAMDTIFKCGKALEYMNALGLVHRDIKPANILITESGDVRLSDLGATLIAAREGQVETGIGTPFYMSPEQLLGHGLDFRSDMFSLGVVFYELLTGEKPFDGDNMQQLMYQIFESRPRPPSEIRPSIPPALDPIIARMMGKMPSARFASWRECLDALTSVTPAAPGQGRQEINLASASERFQLLRESPFFKLFSDADLWYVLEVGEFKRIQQGDVLIREGEVGDCFYVLLSGQVRVSKQGRLIDLVTSGMSMGEISYVLEGRVPRNTTCSAILDGVVLRVADVALQNASETCRSRFEKTFLQTMASWLVDADKRLRAMP